MSLKTLHHTNYVCILAHMQEGHLQVERQVHNVI